MRIGIPEDSFAKSIDHAIDAVEEILHENLYSLSKTIDRRTPHNNAEIITSTLSEGGIDSDKNVTTKVSPEMMGCPDDAHFFDTLLASFENRPQKTPVNLSSECCIIV